MSEPKMPIYLSGIPFTEREKQVLDRVIAGRLSKNICDDLSISLKTVEAHLVNIMAKFDIATLVELRAVALSQMKVKNE